MAGGGERAQRAWRSIGRNRENEESFVSLINSVVFFRLSLCVAFVAVVDGQPVNGGERGVGEIGRGWEMDEGEKGQIMKQSVFVICAKVLMMLLFVYLFEVGF